MRARFIDCVFSSIQERQHHIQRAPYTPQAEEVMADFSADYNKIIEENRIKHGDNFPKIMGGSVEKLDVKEVLYGNQYRTWIIVIADDDKVYTMKFIYGSYVKYHPMFL